MPPGCIGVLRVLQTTRRNQYAHATAQLQRTFSSVRSCTRLLLATGTSPLPANSFLARASCFGTALCWKKNDHQHKWDEKIKGLTGASGNDEYNLLTASQMKPSLLHVMWYSLQVPLHLLQSMILKVNVNKQEMLSSKHCFSVYDCVVTEQIFSSISAPDAEKGKQINHFFSYLSTCLVLCSMPGRHFFSRLVTHTLLQTFHYGLSLLHLKEQDGRSKLGVSSRQFSRQKPRRMYQTIGTAQFNHELRTHIWTKGIHVCRRAIFRDLCFKVFSGHKGDHYPAMNSYWKRHHDSLGTVRRQVRWATWMNIPYCVHIRVMTGTAACFGLDSRHPTLPWSCTSWRCTLESGVFGTVIQVTQALIMSGTRRNLMCWINDKFLMNTLCPSGSLTSSTWWLTST